MSTTHSFFTSDTFKIVYALLQGSRYTALPGRAHRQRLRRGGPHRQAPVSATDSGAIQSTAGGCCSGTGHQHRAQAMEGGPRAQA